MALLRFRAQRVLVTRATSVTEWCASSARTGYGENPKVRGQLLRIPKTERPRRPRIELEVGMTTPAPMDARVESWGGQREVPERYDRAKEGNGGTSPASLACRHQHFAMWPAMHTADMTDGLQG